jgi:cyanophycinase
MNEPGSVFLIGGGWDPRALQAHYAQFLAACPAPAPTVACVVLDEGDGREQFQRFAQALAAAGRCRAVAVLVPLGSVLDPALFADAEGLLVCGGLTPAYAAAIDPARAAIAEWLRGGRPYAGFSAGASVAADRAIVGGWQLDGVPVCPEEAAEDLDEVTIVGGLRLVPLSVEVHCAQWGTLPRLLAAVQSGRTAMGVGLDENTMLTAAGDTATVSGIGRAWLVSGGPDAAQVRLLRAGDRFPLPAR